MIPFELTAAIESAIVTIVLFTGYGYFLLKNLICNLHYSLLLQLDCFHSFNGLSINDFDVLSIIHFKLYLQVVVMLTSLSDGCCKLTYYIHGCYVDAMKINVPTAAASQKDLEVELRKWFTHARDRGDDNRKRQRSAAPGTPAAASDAN